MAIAERLEIDACNQASFFIGLPPWCGSVKVTFTSDFGL